MELSDRKKKILKAITEENIETGEPVSSSKLCEKYLSDLSSATIRNELSFLEDMGFLKQEHTSSGRVPTALGFQYYTNFLIDNEKLSKTQTAQIKKEFEGCITEMEDLVQTAAKAISRATNLPSVVFSGITKTAEISSIKVVKVSENTSLVVCVTDQGIIKDIVLDTSNLGDEALNQASKILTNVLQNKRLNEVAKMQFQITSEFEKYRDVFNMLLLVLKEHSNETQMSIQGVSNLFNHNEFQNVENVQKALRFIENKSEIQQLLDNGDLELSVKIGTDKNLIDCSVVSTTIKIDNGKQITAGVFGPMRMDYSKVLSILKSMSDILKN